MPVNKANSVVSPNLGLYLGMGPANVPKRGMSDCMNVRLRMGKVVRDNLGWHAFPDTDNAINLDDKPVTLITAFWQRNGVRLPVFGNTTDLFTYDGDSGSIRYITPAYTTGTVSVTNGSATVIGSGTSWSSELNAGDFIVVGSDSETSPTAAWYEVASVTNDTSLELTAVYAGATASGQNYTARQTFTGDVADLFFDEIFYNGANVGGGTSPGDRWYATNGIDPVVAWDGGTFCYIPDLGNIDTCAAMRRHKNQMVYVAPTLNGAYEKEKIRTSEIAEPENTVSGEASELVVKDGADALINAYVLGEQLILYAEKSIIVAQYVGSPFVYAFRTAVTGYGPFSPRGIARYPDFHDFSGADLYYRFDGATIQAVDSHVWRDIMRRVAPERAHFLYAHFDESQGELIWGIPLTTDADADTETAPPEKAYVAHYVEDVGRNPTPYSLRDIPVTAIGGYIRDGSLTWDKLVDSWDQYNFRWNDKFFFDQFPMTLFGTIDGDIFVLNGSSSKNGTALDSHARFHRHLLGTIEHKGVVRRIYPFAEQIENSSDAISVKLYAADTLEGRTSLASELDFNLAIADEKHFVTPRKSMRYGEIEVATEDSTHYWAINGYAVDTVRGGAR